jgi:hypothetical protein
MTLRSLKSYWSKASLINKSQLMGVHRCIELQKLVQYSAQKSWYNLGLILMLLTWWVRLPSMSQASIGTLSLVSFCFDIKRGHLVLKAAQNVDGSQRWSVNGAKQFAILSSKETCRLKNLKVKSLRSPGNRRKTLQQKVLLVSQQSLRSVD